MARDTGRGYRGPVIHLARLLDTLGDRISFDSRGVPIHADLPPGPAVMLVSTVTDALKTVRDGVVVDAVDRDTIARVLAFAVDRAVLAQIGEDPVSAEGLIEAVRDQGLRWSLVGQEDALRPFNAQ